MHAPCIFFRRRARDKSCKLVAIYIEHAIPHLYIPVLAEMGDAMQPIKRRFLALILGSIVIAAPAVLTPAWAGDQPSGEDFVAVFNKIYGAHEGFRANHAKGIMAEGIFTPTKKAKSLSKAAHLQGPTVPVTVRFSASGGLPSIPDSDPNAFPKGMAVKFKLPDGTDTDIVCISINGFPASTPKEFYDFLTAISQSPPDAPHPTPVEAFVGSHPAAKHFVVEIPKPTPASFATQPFFGVNAFRFTNAKGAKKYGRYFLVPVAGASYLDPADAAKRPPDFLNDELTERLKKGPVSFKLSVQLAKKGDPINDGTKIWPDSNPKIELGTITITGLVPDNANAQRQILFTPINVTDGIEASDDPIIEARGEAYAVSYSRRAK